MPLTKDATRSTFTALGVYDEPPEADDPADTGPASPETEGDEVDQYAAEFAALVKEYAPSRTDTVAEWLGRLPNEVYRYYDRGIASFGRPTRTPTERRGRLYLLHTALVMMWMTWGKEGAQARLTERAQEGVRRAAYLTIFECYRRGDVLTRYDISDGFSRPPQEWVVDLNTSQIDPKCLPDSALRDYLRRETIAPVTLSQFKELRATGSLPPRGALLEKTVDTA